MKRKRQFSACTKIQSSRQFLFVIFVLDMILVSSLYLCYSMPITKESDIEEKVILMLIEIDFNSDEAIYVQLQNQIIMGIAMNLIQEGDSLPSVRQLANTVGINMHTVNKAYSILKQEGFIRLDRRKGAVIALAIDKLRTLEEMDGDLRVILAKGICKGVSREEAHRMIDEIYEEFGV